MRPRTREEGAAPTLLLPAIDARRCAAPSSTVIDVGNGMPATEASIEGPAPAPGHLLRVLGTAFGIAVGIGAIIGAGILRGPGEIYRNAPNPTLFLGLWALGAVHAALGANVFAELAAAMPRAGGAYVYARRAFGDFGGLLVGWSTWLNHVSSIAGLAVVFAEFSGLLFPGLTGATVPVALVLVAAFFVLNGFGVHSGARFQTVTSALKALALLVFCALALLAAPPPAAVAAAAAEPVTTGGLVVAIQLVLSAYSGWQIPSVFAEEQRDPGRSVPRALFSGVALAAFIYILVNLALLSSLGPGALQAAKFAAGDVMVGIFGPRGRAIALAIGLLTVVSCINTQFMSSARVLYALARDGLAPAPATIVNRGGTPSVALALSSAAGAAFALAGSFTFAYVLLASFTVVMTTVTGAALLVLRRREASLVRPYRAWGHPWTTGAFFATELALLFLFAVGNPTSTEALLLFAAACAGWAFWRRRSATAA
jgi:APA family basic amino acid/polyamine antiporter